MELTVRPATVDDTDAMADVHIAAWRATYAGIFPDDLLARLDPKRFSAGWTDGITSAEADPDQGVTHLVGEVDGVISGFCVVGPFRDRSGDDDPSGELWVINLHPDAHGSGLAKPLHDQGIDNLRCDGHHRAALWVAEANPRARRFYEREGWSNDGIVKEDDFGGSTVIELRYSISL